MRRAIACAALALAACRSHRSEPPTVQPSSAAPFDSDVKVTTKFEFVPACVVIRAGQTVEWWVDPDAGEVPINVTSLGRPLELFSPNLAPPIDCPPGPIAKTHCWRHTFAHAGCFPYFDTNSGNPGRQVVDDYYGTVSFVGDAGSAQRGLICVEGPGVSCAGVCCNANFDCAQGYACRLGRCLRATDQTPSACPAAS